MLSRVFTFAKHEEFGTTGLRADDMPNADPLDGMAVAHDILEHFKRDRGTVEDEFMALGASIFVRGELYFASKGRMHTRPSYQMHGDVAMQYGYLCQRGDSMTIRDPGRTTRLDDWIEDELDELVKLSRRELREMDDDGDARRWLNDQQARRMLGWFRRGYRRAVARYHPHGNGHMVSVFCELENVANEVIQHADYEGQQFRISVDVHACRASYTQIRDPYDY